jgi:hypothetical protein
MRAPPVPGRMLPPACAELLKRADAKPDSDAASLAGQSEPAAAAPTNTTPVISAP